ncbi:MAG: hypothetical protein KME47_09935 [Nodosilinea sp. WJT8-NPBG4]|jgi:hypothetical protein|nr:hypothetical protein [Nodosilinea sp. WJT8-NPBG4]
MRLPRPPDIYVLTESGKHPAFIQGEWSGGLLVAFTQTGVFLINPISLKLVTFAGTELDIEIEPCQTEIWEVFNNA